MVLLSNRRLLFQSVCRGRKKKVLSSSYPIHIEGFYNILSGWLSAEYPMKVDRCHLSASLFSYLTLQVGWTLSLGSIRFFCSTLCWHKCVTFYLASTITSSRGFPYLHTQWEIPCIQLEVFEPLRSDFKETQWCIGRENDMSTLWIVLGVHEALRIQS